jgi:hypothetical protein
MTSDQQREKIFLAVLKYAQKFAYNEEGDYRFPLSEQVYQCDDMQIEGLELVGELLDILNE